MNQDVHRYIPDAVSRGAAAVVGEGPWSEVRAALETAGASPDLAYVQVPNARFARSHIAAALHGWPSRDMLVVGVTGTDGKTTTTSLVHAILSAAGRRSGLVSTVGAEMGGECLDTGLHTTTPEPEDLQAYLARMRDGGVEVAVVEVTSHGLDQHRVSHVAFDVAAITNITHEALEYHETFEAYRRAKGRLFELTAAAAPKAGQAKAAVLNADDPSYEYLARLPAAVPGELHLTYSLAGPADFTARDVSHSASGLAFTADTPAGEVDIRLPMLGHFNAANCLAAMAVAHALGVDREAWSRGIASIEGIPGRMEVIDEGQPHLAVVDFAHTPNALRRALASARELIPPDGKVIAVFGCAGLRDSTKRPMMGRVAGELADEVVVTAEDPRTEDLDAIIGAIAAGVTEAGRTDGRGLHRVPDRFEAVRRANELAGPSDIVLVLGKGHEQSMCFGEVEHPWDDRDALRSALRGESYGDLPTAEARRP